VTTPFWIQVTNDCGATATESVIISVRACTKPSVIIQPASAQVVTGGPASLSASIAGTVPVQFQWFEGAPPDTSRPVTNATSASVTTPLLFSSSSFWLRATNECGTIDTATAAITIVDQCAQPVITSAPRDQSVAPGSVTILSIGVAGPSLTYRWFEGPFGDRTKPLNVSGPSVATSPIDQPTQFWVEVTNPCGRVSSSTITVSPAAGPAGRKRAAGRK
jgi:hypothetical protein